MWVKLDDTLAEHPKIERAGPLAAWLYVAGLCYCARQLTDGRIPRGTVARLATIKRPYDEAARLVAAGLWEEDGEDFRVHDWLAYQPARLKVEADRRTEAGRKKAGRYAQASGRTPGRTPAGHSPASGSESSGPVPVPVPVPRNPSQDRYSEAPRRGGRVVDHGGQLTRAEAIALQAQQHADEARAAESATLEEP
jgi:hypothetical protein